jgi:threonine/homoserine/homoserine lactone efflux protein
MIDFIKGFVIGALISLPVGPIGILCLRRMLLHSPLEGIAAGLGSATVDIFYAIIALFGLSFLKEYLEYHHAMIHLFGSLFLCAIGIKIYVTPVPQQKQPRLYGGIIQSYFSTLLLTVANPVIIFSFLAFFAFFRVHVHTLTAGIPLLIGIFSGAVTWWFILGILTALIHPKLNKTKLQWVNHIAGTTIFVIGLLGLITLAIQQLLLKYLF